MKKPVLATLFAALGLLAPLLAAQQAEAIPAFSRQYKTECKTCHTIIPERNEFGDAFEKNSFVWPSGQPVPAQAGKQAPMPENKNEALWLSGIPEQLPLSLLAQHAFLYNEQSGPGKPKLDLDGETELELFGAGNFQNKVGFWADTGLGKNGEVGELFLQFRHPLDLPFNVKAGKFKPKLSIWKSNDRATVSKFGYHTMKVDGNPFKIGGEQGGVEINSVIVPRLFAATGVTNSPEKDKNGKDWYGHVSARLIGADFLGREPEVELDKENSIADFLSVTVGGFGYVGSSNQALNDFYRTGGEAELLYKRLRVRLNGIYGKDDNIAGSAVKSHFYMAQAEYLIGTKALASLRYEFKQIDGQGIVRSYIPSLSYSPLQNLRLALEYRRIVGQGEPDDPLGALQISFSF